MNSTMSAKNRKFWALHEAQKRVAIAKDIIKQIEAKRIKPSKNVYIDTKVSLGLVNAYEPLDKVLKDQKCEACALGACFISLIDLGDKLKVEDIKDRYPWQLTPTYNINNDNSWRKYLREIFSPKQLTLIESAFEMTNYQDEEDNRDNDKINPSRDKAMLFGKKYRGAKNRLIAICKNIIKNKGTFIP